MDGDSINGIVAKNAGHYAMNIVHAEVSCAVESLEIC